VKENFDEIRRELHALRNGLNALGIMLENHGFELKKHQVEQALKDSELESRMFALSLKLHSRERSS
jgi:hypothetical protein